MVAVMAVETTPVESVVCSNPTCSQVVALRRHNHIHPLGAQMTLDSKGRPNVVCPVCGRYTIVKRSVEDGE